MHCSISSFRLEAVNRFALQESKHESSCRSHDLIETALREPTCTCMYSCDDVPAFVGSLPCLSGSKNTSTMWCDTCRGSAAVQQTNTPRKRPRDHFLCGIGSLAKLTSCFQFVHQMWQKKVLCRTGKSTPNANCR